MEKVKARLVTSGAATRSDVFMTDLWGKSIWAMEEDPRVSQIVDLMMMCSGESLCMRLCTRACGRGLSVCLAAHVPSHLLLRMAKLTFMSESRNKTSALTRQNRRFLSVSFPLFFFLMCVPPSPSWCSVSYSIRWSRVEEEILWAESGRCSTVWPLFTVSGTNSKKKKKEWTHQASVLWHSRHETVEVKCRKVCVCGTHYS